MSDVVIEKAVAGDFLEVAALDRVAWQQNRYAEYIPDGEHAWRIWCEYALCFVARQDGKVVGAVLAFMCNTGEYWLHKVIVELGCRGQGIGGKLFDAVLAAIDKQGAATFLSVDPENEAAIRLYESYGFTERRFEKGYYRTHEDRYILRRAGC